MTTTERVFTDVKGIHAAFLWPVKRGSELPAVRSVFRTNRIVFPEQVHSTSIAVVSATSPEVVEGVDGLVTSSSVALAAAGADCQVLLVVDPFQLVVGIAHAGWKGVLAGMGRQLVKTMIGAGALLRNLRIAVGPSIGPCCYIVDRPDTEPRFERFREQFGSDVAFERGGEKVIDLLQAQRQTLKATGLRANQISIDDRCTVCASEQLPSHRREGVTRTKNLIGCIMITLK